MHLELQLHLRRSCPSPRGRRDGTATVDASPPPLVDGSGEQPGEHGAALQGEDPALLPAGRMWRPPPPGRAPAPATGRRGCPAPASAGREPCPPWAEHGAAACGLRARSDRTIPGRRCAERTSPVPSTGSWRRGPVWLIRAGHRPAVSRRRSRPATARGRPWARNRRSSRTCFCRATRAAARPFARPDGLEHLGVVAAATRSSAPGGCGPARSCPRSGVSTTPRTTSLHTWISELRLARATASWKAMSASLNSS